MHIYIYSIDGPRSENIKKAVESEVSNAVDTVKQHMLSVQKMDLQKAWPGLLEYPATKMIGSTNWVYMWHEPDS